MDLNAHARNPANETSNSFFNIPLPARDPPSDLTFLVWARAEAAETLLVPGAILHTIRYP